MNVEQNSTGISKQAAKKVCTRQESNTSGAQVAVVLGLSIHLHHCPG
jgi:hypothetical protein